MTPPPLQKAALSKLSTKPRTIELRDLSDSVIERCSGERLRHLLRARNVKKVFRNGVLDHLVVASFPDDREYSSRGWAPIARAVIFRGRRAVASEFQRYDGERGLKWVPPVPRPHKQQAVTK